MASRIHAGHYVDKFQQLDPMRKRSAGPIVAREARHARSSSTSLGMASPGPVRPMSSLSTTSTLVSNTSLKHTERQDTFVKPFDRQYRRRPTPTVSSTNDSTRKRRSRADTPSTSQTRINLRPKPTGFVYRDGRRYLQDSPYILPHDLQEIQRQNLSTILTTTVLGSPLRCPIDPLDPPKNILEMGCADGYWSNLCHDFFVHLGVQPPAFTGLDIAPQGPDLRKFGVDWTYVQHDLHIRPLPFPDETFDVIMSKDMTIAISFETWWLMLPELLRILRPKGFLEFRDRDYKFRTMKTPACVPIESSLDDALIARETACYPILPETEFVDCENSYLRDVSNWTQQLMESRGQHPTPMKALEGINSWYGWEHFEVRRIAIPLSPLTQWERQTLISPEGDPIAVQLDVEQRAIRSTALEIVIEFIRSLKPPLMRMCGKNEEEWRRWWDFMINDLIDEDGAASGECLEIGVAWGRKEIKSQK